MIRANFRRKRGSLVLALFLQLFRSFSSFLFRPIYNPHIPANVRSKTRMIIIRSCKRFQKWTFFTPKGNPLPFVLKSTSLGSVEKLITSYCKDYFYSLKNKKNPEKKNLQKYLVTEKDFFLPCRSHDQ